MEYRRRRTRRVSTRYGQSRTTQSGGAWGAVFMLAVIVGLVYLLSTSAAGTWLAKNVVAPVFNAFSHDASVVKPSDSSDAQSVFSNTAEEGVSASVELPEMSAYMLQMGIYASPDNAENAATELANKGAGGYVYNDNGMYRVFAAGYSDAKSAESVRTTLNAEGYACKLYELSGKGKTFGVTLSDEKFSEETQAAFDALKIANTSISALAVDFDKQSMSVDDASKEIGQTYEKLKNDFAILLTAKKSSDALEMIVNCYNNSIGLLENLKSACENCKKTVDFSSKIKYTDIALTCSYVQLLTALAA